MIWTLIETWNISSIRWNDLLLLTPSKSFGFKWFDLLKRRNFIFQSFLLDSQLASFWKTKVISLIRGAEMVPIEFFMEIILKFWNSRKFLKKCKNEKLRIKCAKVVKWEKFYWNISQLVRTGEKTSCRLGLIKFKSGNPSGYGSKIYFGSKLFAHQIQFLWIKKQF